MNPVAAGRFSPATPGGRPVNWAATGRSGGVSTGVYAGLNLASHVGDESGLVEQNRQRVAAMLDVPAICMLDAQHGGNVVVVHSSGIARESDAVVTTAPRLGLLALAADCVPIVLADPDAHVIAAVHCGWRGLGAGVVTAAVSVMREQGATRIRAVTGPAICVGCYPVGLDCVQALQEQLDAEAFAASTRRQGSQWQVDVRAGVHHQLHMEGIVATSVKRCTATDERLYSFRAAGQTGRQGMIVAL